MSHEKLLDRLTFNEQGFIPTIVADAVTHRALTLCYLNRQALLKTLETGKVHVFRRSEGRLMLKGETSGHIQQVQRIFIDCEGKSLLLLVKQHMGACHKGYTSCYFEEYDPAKNAFSIAEERVFDPEKAYNREAER